MGKASGIREMGLKIQQLFILMFSVQQGPPGPLGGSHIVWGHHEHWGAHVGNPEPKGTRQTPCLWHTREAPRNFPL